MTEVETFLRSPDGSFTKVEVCQEVPPDPDYVEGAIVLSVDGVEILGLPEWDYVDQLWSYLSTMLVELEAEGRAETSFPDQPIRFAVEAVGGSRLLVTVEFGAQTRRVATDRQEFVDSLRRAGLEFFDGMARLVPGNSYDRARARLGG